MPGAFVNSDLASTLGAAEVFFFFFKEPLAPSFPPFCCSALCLLQVTHLLTLFLSSAFFFF